MRLAAAFVLAALAAISICALIDLVFHPTGVYPALLGYLIGITCLVLAIEATRANQ